MQAPLHGAVQGQRWVLILHYDVISKRACSSSSHVEFLSIIFTEFFIASSLLFSAFYSEHGCHQNQIWPPAVLCHLMKIVNSSVALAANSLQLNHYDMCHSIVHAYRLLYCPCLNIFWSCHLGNYEEGFGKERKVKQWAQETPAKSGESIMRSSSSMKISHGFYSHRSLINYLQSERILVSCQLLVVILRGDPFLALALLPSHLLVSIHSMQYA